MPDKDLTEIVFILDRSGSMAARISDVIGGFNTMVADQRKQPGRAVATVVLFDTGEDTWLHEACPIEGLQDLTRAQYEARGGTALYDAVANAVKRVGARLARTPEERRPGKVVVVIFTDGEENSSVEYDYRRGGAERLRQVIEHQKTKYNWGFTFIGTNQDAVLEAGKIGVGAGQAIVFANNAAGISNVMRAASRYVGQSRAAAPGVSLDSMTYSATDRAEAMVEEDDSAQAISVGQTGDATAAKVSTP